MKKPETVKDIFNAFDNLKIMIIGDVMTDAYVFGKVERISPEAPVPVVHISGREMRPGGAANVAKNIIAMGAKPILCSVIGNDHGGKEFISLLEKENINPAGILVAEGRKTTVKTRVMGNNHQLVRIDDETIEGLNKNTISDFIITCKNIIESEKPHIIIMEDYDKGVLSKEIIDAVTGMAIKANIPTAVDPKHDNFNTYHDVTLFKPNLHELRSGLGLSLSKINAETLKEATDVFISERNIKMVMVTLSDQGVFIADKNHSYIIPAHMRNISDVSGAGDTVIAIAALCLASGMPVKTIAKLSNLAGGLVCESVGVVPIDRKKLLDESERMLSVSDL